MITRFYVDNYKCLVNFEYKPKSFELIVGANGSGKTTFFDALKSLQNVLLKEESVEISFNESSTTRWQTTRPTRIELSVSEGDDSFRYEVSILSPYGAFIAGEKLYRNEEIVSESIWRSVANSDGEGVDGSDYLEVTVNMRRNNSLFRVVDVDKSAVIRTSSMFKRILEKLFILRLQPSSISSMVTTANRRLDEAGMNFAAYYLYVLQEKQDLIFDLLPILRENIAGFRSFALEERGRETRQLHVDFVVEGGKKGQTVRYNFEELSDGQRALIVLYTVAFCEPGATLLIDEPENFIALRELQPLLTTLRDKQEESGGQVILISHHPEFINMLAPQDAVLFERQDGAHTRIKPFSMNGVEAITPAELVARGWESDGE